MKKYIFLTVISTILLVNCDFLSTQKKNEKDAYVINETYTRVITTTYSTQLYPFDSERFYSKEVVPSPIAGLGFTVIV